MDRREILIIIHQKPVSINRAYGIGKSRRGSSPIFFAKKDHHRIKLIAAQGAFAVMNAHDYKMTEAPVTVEFDYYFVSRRPDVTNFEKPFLDGMEGIVYRNDNQVGDNSRPEFQDKIYSCIQRKYLDKNNPRTEIKIAWFEPKTERVKNAKEKGRRVPSLS